MPLFFFLTRGIEYINREIAYVCNNSYVMSLCLHVHVACQQTSKSRGNLSVTNNFLFVCLFYFFKCQNSQVIALNFFHTFFLLLFLLVLLLYKLFVLLSSWSVKSFASHVLQHFCNLSNFLPNFSFNSFPPKKMHLSVNLSCAEGR